MYQSNKATAAELKIHFDLYIFFKTIKVTAAQMKVNNTLYS